MSTRSGRTSEAVRARLGVTAAFAAHGAVSGSLGPRIPTLKEQSGLDPAGLGLGLTGFAIGLLLGTRLAGPAVRALGSRRVLRTATPMLCLALGTVPLARGLPSLTAAFAGLGIVGGVLDVAMNTQAVAVEREYRRPVMSSIHAAWSLGMLAGAALGAAAAAAGLSPILHFGIVAVALSLGSFALLRDLLPPDVEWRGSAEPAGRVPRRLRSARDHPVVATVLLAVIAFGSFLAEGAAADWSAVYLRDALGASGGLAGLAVVAFSLGMASARLTGDRLSSVLRPDRLLRIGGLAAGGSMAIGLALGTAGAAIVAFGILGLCLGPVVPIAFSAAGNTPAGRPGVALGWVVTAGYLGSIAGPALIGVTADRFGLRLALGIPAVLALAIAVAARAAARAPVGVDRTSGPTGRAACPP